MASLQVAAVLNGCALAAAPFRHPREACEEWEFMNSATGSCKVLNFLVFCAEVCGAPMC